MKNNLDRFKKTIIFSIIAPLIFFIIMISMVFVLIIKNSKFNSETAEKRQISTINKLFQQQLSEELSIIASSNIFIDFLTSGDITRKLIFPQFVSQLSRLKSSGVVGISLFGIERDSKFDFGKITNYTVTLKLCYLGNRLDSNYGNCNYRIKLFFSPEIVYQSLARLSDNVYLSKTSQLYDLFAVHKFGSFNIDEHSKFLIHIGIKQKESNAYIYYIFIIFILILFAILNAKRIIRLINLKLAEPLGRLVSDIQTDSNLYKFEYSLYEINYLINHIEEWKNKIREINFYEKNLEICSMAAELAHDIRSPLAVMEIMLKSIQNDMPVSKIDLLRESIFGIREIASNLLVKYRNHNENSELNLRSQSGNCHCLYKIEPVNLSTTIYDLINLKLEEWGSDQCAIKVNICNDVSSIYIKLDRLYLVRILSNLFNNAYESLRDKRVIEIYLSNIHNDLHLRISDKGVGIPAFKLHDVLSGVSLKHNGVGIGLSTAAKYMKSIGGRLELYSKVDQGTDVVLIFPISVVVPI